MVRKAIVRILTSEPAFEIVGEAKDPYEAKDLIIHHDPDVITLDIEMPSMDGIQFLKLRISSKVSSTFEERSYP
jgi:two-component system chemotaxis response regulator CheB